MTDAVEAELPRAVALAGAWLRTPQRGPKREISIERIVEAAIELADAEGLAPSRWPRRGVRSASRRCRCTATSPQRRPDAAHAGGGVRRADPAPRTTTATGGRGCGLGRRLDGRHQRASVVRRHPHLGHPDDAQQPRGARLGPADHERPAADDLEKMLDSAAARVVLARFRHRRARRAPGPPSRTAQTPSAAKRSPAALAELVTPERFPYLGPLVASGAYTAPPGEDGQDDFAFGLERILDGIEKYVDARSAGEPVAARRSARNLCPTTRPCARRRRCGGKRKCACGTRANASATSSRRRASARRKRRRSAPERQAQTLAAKGAKLRGSADGGGRAVASS